MDYPQWHQQQITTMQQLMWNHPDKYTLGFSSKPRRGNGPGLYAEQVLTMHPDQVREGITFWNQSEREIYELTPAGQSVPMVPHILPNDLSPRHLRVEELKRRLNCTWKQAERIRDAMEVLDATPEIVDQFVSNRLRAGPEKLEAGIGYIENLAGELKLLETEPVLEVPDEYIRATIGEFTDLASRGAEALMLHVARVTERDDDHKLADADNFGIETFGLSKWEPGGDEEEQLAELAEGNPMESERVLADVIGYHRVGEKPQGDWLTKQPLAYRSLIRWLEGCQEPGRLAEIGKLVYEGLDVPKYLEEASKSGLDARPVRILKSLVKGSRAFRKEWKPVGTTRDEIRIDGGWMDVSGVLYAPVSWTTCGWIEKALGKQDAAKVIDYYTSNVPPMSRAQLAYFWVKYRAARARFEGDPEIKHNSQPDKLIRRIWATKTKAQLDVLGSNLKKFQKRIIPGSKVNPAQWRGVWKTFWKHMDYVSKDGLELTHCTKKGGQVPFGLSPNNPKGGHPYDHPGKARKR